MTTLWKSLPRDMKPRGFQYSLKKLHKCKGKIELCNNGFHASRNVIDAMSYVNAEVIAKVEVQGKSDKQDDKQAWSEMRMIEAYEWTKEDSVSLAIYAAKQVIDIYEKKYPKDKRPKEAINAAENYLKNPKEENGKKCFEAADAAARAAWAAGAAEAAEAAAWAAEAAAGAAWAAEAAARAAGAARAAAWAAEAAARAAAWAAWAADIKSKCHKFVLRRLNKKKPLTKLLND